VDKPVEKIIITSAKSMALPTIPPSLTMKSGYTLYYTPFITSKSTLFFYLFFMHTLIFFIFQRFVEKHTISF